MQAGTVPLAITLQKFLQCYTVVADAKLPPEESFMVLVLSLYTRETTATFRL